MVYPAREGYCPRPDGPKACPERFRLTVAITESGALKSWQVTDLKGAVLEEWATDRGSEAHRHTWEVAWDTYLVARDMLRFIGEDNWEPGTVM